MTHKYRDSDKHSVLRIGAFCVAAALAGCLVDPVIFTGIEDCQVAGDEDGNGQADCADPACAAAAACQPVCGDGVPSGPEQCDDGNLVTETACPYGTASCTLCNATCSAPLALTGNVCGDGVPSGPEQCDDGNLVTETACPYGTASCTLCEASCTATLLLSGNVCGDGNSGGPELCDDGHLLDGDGCDNNCTVSVALLTYIKASNTNAEDQFGDSIALSKDGSTLAVGARRESSAATGINGDQADNSASNAGAVYVYTRSGTTWSQQAYVKASNTNTGDQFGQSIALSEDGSTLVVGAIGEDSAATGTNGDQANNSMPTAGAVYVYTRSGTTWSQQAYVKASNTNTGDRFGWRVALSGDGSTLAVGAYTEASAATGINGNQADNSAPAAGAVYTYTRSGTTWSQEAYVKASNTDANDQFGWSVALSEEGSTLAVGTWREASAATGINGDQADNSAITAGAAYVYTRSGTTWSQQAYVKASNTDAGDEFGRSVALSEDGSTLAVGAIGEASTATGINGAQLDNSAPNSGAAYVYMRSGTTWGQQAYVKASNTNAGDQLGWSIALSGDGSTLAASAIAEDSAATGINGDQADNSAITAGAVYMYTRSGTTWSQQTYVKSFNTDAGDEFGRSAALSEDGSTLVVGAYAEDSAATGINGDQADNSAVTAGAVYVYPSL